MTSQVTSQRDRILEVAATRQGIPYRLDPPPDGTTTLDCSLLVKLTLAEAGLPLPGSVRTAEQIRQTCDPIDWDSVDKGDLLFFEGTYDAAGPAGPDGHIASHVGFSLGKGTRRMWDCHASGDSGPPGVGETDISTAYWQSKIFEARRPRGIDAGGGDGGGGSGTAQGTYVLTDDAVHMRAQPSTSADVLVQNMGAGTTVTEVSDQVVEADGHQWRNVRTAGQVGWVAAEFLQLPGSGSAGGGDLTDEVDHAFGFAALWPYIQVAAGKSNADAKVVAATMQQESGFTNWRVHRDGTGHGLFGLDDNGLLPDFEQSSGISCGRGFAAISIPPKPQIDYACKIIAAYALQFGSAINAARVWHRGPTLWQDELGQHYADLIRAHLQTLFPNS
jgi:hypothetical protein